MRKERVSQQEGDANKYASLITRDDIALGTAGFVAGLDVIIGGLIPGRVTNPVVEGEMVFRQTLVLLKRYLPELKTE